MHRFTSLTLISVTALLTGCATRASSPLPAQSPVGTWRIVSFSRHDIESGKNTNLKGDAPTGYLTYTAGGHVVVCLIGDNRRPQAGEVANDEERSAWFQDIISAYSGTYTVQGDKITHHVDSAWVPNWYGSDQTRYFAIEGKRLVIKTAPLKSTFDGRQVVNTLTFDRVD